MQQSHRVVGIIVFVKNTENKLNTNSEQYKVLQYTRENVLFSSDTYETTRNLGTAGILAEQFCFITYWSTL